MLGTLQRDPDAASGIDWSLWCIGGFNMRAPKAAAGAGKKLPPYEPQDHAFGRSRGGWGTKLNLVTDGARPPLAVQLSAGQASEAWYAEPVLDAVHLSRPSRTVRRRSEQGAGTKAYNHPAFADSCGSEMYRP